nr:hypothetical protein [uncultured Agathobaculum sp.]
MRTILLALLSACSLSWFVWPFAFVGTLTGLIRRAVRRTENTTQEQRENSLIAWGFAAGFSLLMVCVSVVSLAGMII